MDEQQIEVSKKIISNAKKSKNRKRHHNVAPDSHVPHVAVSDHPEQQDGGGDEDNLLKELDKQTLKNSQVIEKQKAEVKRRGSISQVKILSSKRPLGYRVFAINKSTYIILR